MSVIEQSGIRRQYGAGWIRESWELFKLAPVIWIGALAAAWVISFLIDIVIQLPISGMTASATSHAYGASSPTIPLWDWIAFPFIWLAQLFLSSYVLSGYLRLGLAAMRRQMIRVEDVFSGWPSTLRVFCYNLVMLFGLGVSIGIPAAAIGYCFYRHLDMPVLATVVAVATVVICLVLVLWTYVTVGVVYVVDGGGVMDAYRCIFTTMRPHYGPILGAVTLVVLMCMAAICTLGLALLVLMPMWFIMIALIGRDTMGLPAAPEAYSADWLPPGGDAGPGAWPPPPSQ